jgi:hypothetical protein
MIILPSSIPSFELFIGSLFFFHLQKFPPFWAEDLLQAAEDLGENVTDVWSFILSHQPKKKVFELPWGGSCLLFIFVYAQVPSIHSFTIHRLIPLYDYDDSQQQSQQ